MQEGILALMQLPKTVCALEELHESGGVMISVLTHPTTGGLLASFASLGDVLLAEPGALMSFAGPRVVAQTTRERLPDDFVLALTDHPVNRLYGDDTELRAMIESHGPRVRFVELAEPACQFHGEILSA